MNLVTIASLAAIFFVLTLLIANILQHRHLFRGHFQRKSNQVEPEVQDSLVDKATGSKQE